MPDDDTIPVRDAALRMGISESLVRKLIRDGDLPAKPEHTARGVIYAIKPEDCHYTPRPRGNPGWRKKETTG